MFEDLKFRGDWSVPDPLNLEIPIVYITRYDYNRNHGHTWREL